MNREAIQRTIDWLEANPDKHIMGALACDANGNDVDNLQSPHASCFCALGRLAYEVGIDNPWTGTGSAYAEIIQKAGIPPLDNSYMHRANEIYSSNDREWKEGDLDMVGTLDQGNPAVIDYLKELLDASED